MRCPRTFLLLVVSICYCGQTGSSQEFDRVVGSFGNLSTIAGKADVDGGGVNGWQSFMEGQLATGVELSRPHMATVDAMGLTYIADKDAHAIRQVNLDGTVQTIAGTNVAGFNGDGLATDRQLNQPNGLFTFSDGTHFILDLGNSRIRRLSPDGHLSTLMTDPQGIQVGRGLWVNATEDLAYYSSGSELKKWTLADGVSTVAGGFTQLGNLAVDPFDGKVVVTDRGTRDVNDGSGHRVWKVSDDGSRVAIAGSGATNGSVDSQDALSVALHEVRAIDFETTGGFYLATHRASDAWYVDTQGVAHLLIEGNRDNDTHAGDGQPLTTPGEKISEPRSIVVGAQRELIIVENDGGYVRRVPRQLNVAGDFDYDGLLTAHDIDLLSTVVQQDTHPASFNLNFAISRLIDQADREVWVRELADTEFGDANLDGTVGFSDFLVLSSAFGESGGWAQGDFDGSGEVGFADFLSLSTHFGNVRPAAVQQHESFVVPEPQTAPAWLCIFMLWMRRRRK